MWLFFLISSVSFRTEGSLPIPNIQNVFEDIFQTPPEGDQQ